MSWQYEFSSADVVEAQFLLDRLDRLDLAEREALRKQQTEALRSSQKMRGASSFADRFMASEHLNKDFAKEQQALTVKQYARRLRELRGLLHRQSTRGL